MIVILDYGLGNSASLLNMIRKTGREAILCNSPKGLSKASTILLPGVGSFDNAMKKLNDSGFIPVLEEKVLLQKIPFLGICVGMQLLFRKSEEGNLKGLGWLKGNVTKFNFSKINSQKILKVPHMGWNIIKPLNNNYSYSLERNEKRFYFVHSFHVNCEQKSDITASCNYGYEFTCSVRKKNIWGVQFHPEKSHKFGIEFFKNFFEEIHNA